MMSSCGCCEKELNSMEIINEELRRKVKETRDRYITLLSENIKKDYTLGELNKKFAIEGEPKEKFATFEPVLGEGGIEKIRLISNEKSKDSTFILTIIRLLFNEETLNNLTVSGRKETEKLPIEKMNVITMMFRERLQNSEDFEQRFRKLKIHTKNAIFNSRPTKKGEKPAENNNNKNDQQLV